MLNAGGNAVIALIFAEYINRLFYTHTNEEVSPDDIPQWAIKLTAVSAVLVVTILCIAARKLGTRVAVVFTSLKVAALVRSSTEFQICGAHRVHRSLLRHWGLCK